MCTRTRACALSHPSSPCSLPALITCKGHSTAWVLHTRLCLRPSLSYSLLWPPGQLNVHQSSWPIASAILLSQPPISPLVSGSHVPVLLPLMGSEDLSTGRPGSPSKWAMSLSYCVFKKVNEIYVLVAWPRLCSSGIHSVGLAYRCLLAAMWMQGIECLSSVSSFPVLHTGKQTFLSDTWVSFTSLCPIHVYLCGIYVVRWHFCSAVSSECYLMCPLSLGCRMRL